jgi:hypothetical protein
MRAESATRPGRGDIELGVLTGDKILAVQNAGTGAVAVVKAVIAALH